MTDSDKAALNPKMQEAVSFVELWQLSGSIIEFLRAIEWPDDAAGRTKAKNRANYFRTKGVSLKQLDMQYEDLDYAHLQLRATAALAQLAGREEEARIKLNELERLRHEAITAVHEIRDLRSMAVKLTTGV